MLLKLWKKWFRSNEVEVCSSIETKESVYSKLFTFIENYLNYIEKLLIWEKPLQSFILLITLNGVFWLFITSSHRFFFFLSMATLLIFLYKSWKAYYSIDFHADDDTTLMSSSQNVAVSQVTYYLLQLWSGICQFVTFLYHLRYRHHGAFFVLMSSALAMLAILGHFVSGTCLTYIIFLCLLLWPGIRHKKLFQLPELRYSVFRNSEDQELEEFLPALESENESDLEVEKQPILSDSEIAEETYMDFFEESIAQALVTGLPQFSHFDQESTTDSLDIPTLKNDIQFISSHFQDSDSDAEEFAHGLGFNKEISEQVQNTTLSRQHSDSDLTDFEIVNQDDVDKV